MGNDISPGHTYTTGNPGNQVTAQNLNDHVGEAQIKETFVSSKSLKSSPQLSDVILITDGTLKKTTLDDVQTLFEGNMVLGTANYGNGTITALSLSPDVIHAQTEKTTPVDNDEVLVWDSAASVLKKSKRSAFVPSPVFAQMAKASTAGWSSMSTVIPFDDTKPQNTEGTQILSASITPTSASNYVRVRFYLCLGRQSNTDPNLVCALFRTGTTDSIYSVFQGFSDRSLFISGEYVDSPASTSAQTYSLRIGPDTSVSIYLNGVSSRLLGGASIASLILEEIKP